MATASAAGVVLCIADRTADLGVGHPTVGRVRNELEDGGTLIHHDARVGRDGVSQPVRRPSSPRRRASPRPASPPPVSQDREDGPPPQERWQNSFSNLAVAISARSALWTHLFGEDWERFEVSSELASLVKQANEDWTRIGVRVFVGEDLRARPRRGTDLLIGIATGEHKRCDHYREAQPHGRSPTHYSQPVEHSESPLRLCVTVVT